MGSEVALLLLSLLVVACSVGQVAPARLPRHQLALAGLAAAVHVGLAAAVHAGLAVVALALAVPTVAWLHLKPLPRLKALK